MKGKFGKIGKTLLAVVVGLVILDGFCYWYYNPLAYRWDESRATDTVRQANSFTSRATEGFGQATTDDNGYNNPALPEGDIFVLAMGSSHMEGFNVMQDETIASQLSEMLEAAHLSDSVYNIGMSSHTLGRNIANLDRALTRFQPTGYVVLETHDIGIYEWEFNKAMSDNFGRRSATDVNLPDVISERPLLRTLYNQYMMLSEGRPTSSNARLDASLIEVYNQAMLTLMQKVSDVAQSHGVTPMIVYHPHLQLGEDGAVSAQTDENCLNALYMACESTGVILVDMTDEFIDYYHNTCKLPHGFSNTMPGVGHLNADGHRLVAQALYEKIVEREREL